MASRVSRRRAVARGFLLFAGIRLTAGWQAQPASAQIVDLPADLPLPADPPPVSPPPVPNLEPVVPVSQTNDDAEPADAPLPEIATSGPWGVPPVKLTIPALGVEAAVEPVGEAEDGAMATPTHPDDVAWWQLGPGMGVPGNVVFAAHVNWDNRLRPFGLLHRLQEGDAIQVIDEQGRGFEYRVESSEWVRAEGAPLEEIFAQPDVPVITLITCGGEYIAARREYLDRLIVKARGQ